MKIHNESRSDALRYTNIKGGAVFNCMYMRDVTLFIVGICEKEPKKFHCDPPTHYKKLLPTLWPSFEYGITPYSRVYNSISPQRNVPI